MIIVHAPLGSAVTNDCDTLARKVRVWDAMGGVTRYSYDPNGNRTTALE